MYVIEPLYNGDISIESTFEGSTITHLVYELDETWNGDMLMAGTDVFVVGGELLDILRSNHFKGFALRDMEVIYEGECQLPEFMQLIPEKTLKVIHSEYKTAADNDIYLTQNIGEIAVSDSLFGVIQRYMNNETFEFHQIFFKDNTDTSVETYNYEYVVITACSTPFDLLPLDIKKHSILKNGTYTIKHQAERVYVSAPYLECLRQFDIDVHGYMNIHDPYFLVVKSNNKSAALAIIKSMCSRNFYIAHSFSEKFIECLDFINKNNE